MISDNHSAGLILNESRVSGDISKNHDIPSAIHYQNTLITNAKGLKDIFSDEFESIGQEQIILIKVISKHIEEITIKVIVLVVSDLNNLIITSSSYPWGYEIFKNIYGTYTPIGIG